MADDYIYEPVEFDDPPDVDRRSRPRTATRSAPSSGVSDVSYPLVERRRRNFGPPDGVERRHDRLGELSTNDVSVSPSQLIEAPPLAPFRWGALVDRPSVQEELRLHAMRIARLTRIQELAEVEGKDAVEARALKAVDRENARHDKRMQELALTPAAIPGGPK